MITEKDLEIARLSPTKKDFYQLWNELLDTAGKISDRWDPTSTNESDPGIVLLKVLTGIADKLNYNIDKNILEAFMPSATQQESMRKLCELVGYNIKYYQSAETQVTIGWTGKIDNSNFKVEDETLPIIYIPMFSKIKDNDEEIIYTTTEECQITGNIPTTKVACIEGQVVQCSPDTDYIISLDNLDDNNRYYLPEAQIAENGLFIYTVNDGSYLKNKWTKVDNLNAQATGSLVYKFGFDSQNGLPYVQFPADISALIEDGLYIWYTRTLGVNGNVSARTLVNLEIADYDGAPENLASFKPYVSVNNENAAMNGTNIETITQAYNNFKKTVGTFDTLVTCRDYMNKIYQLYDDMNIPLVSNIIVSDIRDDINKAVTLCTFDQYGIKYADTKLTTGTGTDKKDRITNFDLILYPFTTVYGLNNKTEYTNSFKYSSANFDAIKRGIATLKTISHNLVLPGTDSTSIDEIVCVKNYFKINAKITTTTKVNAIEEAYILDNIYKNLYKTFNMRELDFGENIPFDSILECIEEADTRIKNVSMEEPEIETRICLANSINDEIKVTDNRWTTYYSKLIARNILAGKIALLDYNESFKPEITEENYGEGLNPQYNTITKISPKCEIISSAAGKINSTQLYKNEIVQFRAPNFKTTVTYPAYVNYFAHFNSSDDQTSGGQNTQDAVAATMMTLKTFMASHWSELVGDLSGKANAEKKALVSKAVTLTNVTSDNFNELKTAYGCLFNGSGTGDNFKFDSIASGYTQGATYYCLPVTENSFMQWHNYIKSSPHYNGLYWRLNMDLSRPIGKLVDESHWKYRLSLQPQTVLETQSLDKYYIQDVTADPAGTPEADKTYGVGRDASNVNVKSGVEYKLQDGEYILINYTQAADEASGKAEKIINEVLKAGDIIKPNFDLVDSDKWAETHTYAKTTQGSFGPWPNYNTPAGMFTLGPNEQIEQRKPVKVELKSDSLKNIYVYWNLNNVEQNQKFPTTGSNGYTLQDGEYFYYTDENKLEMSYFGSGTNIKVSGITLVKSDNSVGVTAEDILDNGITAIPWVTAPIDKDTRTIIIAEYQYITIAEGDAIIEASLAVSGETDIGDSWVKVSSARYRLAGEDHDLPQIAAGDDAKWEIHSKLLINAGPAQTQTLKQPRDQIDITYNNGSTETLAPTSADKPLSFKTNLPCQIVNDTIDINSNLNLSIKLFAEKLPQIHYYDKTSQSWKDALIPLNNFGKKWTKINYNSIDAIKAQTKEYDATIDLATTIDTNQFGILMFYYIKNMDSQEKEGTTTDKNGYLEFESAETGNNSPAIYNYRGNSGGSNADKWWDNLAEDPTACEASPTEDTTVDEEKTYYTKSETSGGTPGYLVDANGYSYTAVESPTGNPTEAGYYEVTKVGHNNTQYFLKPGINCVRIPSNYTKIIIHKNTNQTTAGDVVVVSQLDVVNCSTNNPDGVNYELLGLRCDKAAGSDPTVDPAITDVADLLELLRNLDEEHIFYYNCQIDNSSAIDLNTTKRDGKYIETLKSPIAWFDYNNVNNKFVISEIDADYLEHGITLTRSSRL